MIRPFLALATGMSLLVPASARATGPLAASFTEYGPYGDPLLLQPPTAPAVQSPRTTFRGENSGAPAAAAVLDVVDGRSVHEFAALGSLPVAAPTSEIRDREDEKLPPPLPGTFRSGAIRVPALPGAEIKSQLVTPHLTPDVEVIRSGRTTVGFFGDVSRVELERSGTLPTVKAHGVGAGLTLQYKFGE